MTPKNSEFRAHAAEIYENQAFAQSIGITLGDVGEGWIELWLEIVPQHLQHDGFVHGGVLATLADTALAYAAHTLIASDQQVLTIEFKINYLRASRHGRLLCRGQVLRPGKTVTVSEAEVYSVDGDTCVLLAKALGTIAIVDAKPEMP